MNIHSSAHTHAQTRKCANARSLSHTHFFSTILSLLPLVPCPNCSAVMLIEGVESDAYPSGQSFLEGAEPDSLRSQDQKRSSDPAQGMFQVSFLGL